MDSGGNGGGGGVLSPESKTFLTEGISLVLARWTALQMAVENQWGGRDSRQKSADLASAILAFFTQSRGPLYIDDLEEMLDECMDASFNTVLEDGSIEEVAEELMIMHEDCLKGNYDSVEKLRNLVPGTSAVSRSKLVDNGDEDGSSDGSSDEEASDMMLDEPAPPKEIAVDRPSQKQMPDEDGWSVVAPRRGRGKKSG